MSVFYILPPRDLVSLRLGRFLQSLLPGTEWNQQTLDQMVENLENMAGTREPSYLVHREDLPRGHELLEALRDGFGAESGDEIVEVRLGAQPEEVVSRRWSMP